MRRLIIFLIVLGLLGFAAFWLLSAPKTLAETDLPEHTPDLANGETMFWAGGCESCHAAERATGEEALKLGGGQAFKTQFGTFFAPNISTDREHGIGGWTPLQFVNAVKLGVAPGGVHLYPALPYTSYQHMRLEDLLDLKAFMDTLPAVATPSRPHDVPFPFSIRRGIGLWKLLYVDGRTLVPDAAKDAVYQRGQYLVEGPAHCGECHTPRNFIGGPDKSRAYGGGPEPDGDGKIPNITPDPTALGDWSVDDIAAMLKTGMTPGFDSVGGSMAGVVRSTAHLSDADRTAIGTYIAALPEVESPPEPPKPAKPAATQ
jgi:mono/diheme cytochrome c family protein